MRVEICNDSRSWDSFVESAPGATVYHKWAWKKVIKETYGHPTYYLAAQADGCVQGVLPLVRMKSWLFGDFLVSVPFSSFGGALAESPVVLEALLARAVEIGRELSVRHIELRQGGSAGSDWQAASAKVLMQVRVDEGADALWARLSSRLRNKVRKARNSGLRIEWSGAEQVKSFYSVFAANMRNLGTPVYPRRWFEAVCRNLPESARLLVLRDGDTPVAATLVLADAEKVELPWIASVPAGRRKYASELLYWTAIEWATERGFGTVDFGRCTRGGGVHRFKQQWGCEETPLRWQYWLPEGSELPEIRPDNPKFRLAVAAWRKLPLFVANRLGPRIVKAIP